MSKGKLLFCVGMPRSGKSTWCNNWVSQPEVGVQIEKHTRADGSTHDTIVGVFVDRPRVVIAGDDFRTALYGRHYQPEAEGTVFATMDVATRAFLNRGFDVIVDETCTTQVTLMRYLRIDIDAEPVWIQTSAEVCKQRAIESGKPYLIPVIERHNDQLTRLKADWTTILWRCKELARSRHAFDIAV
jgi:predicted kinase